MKRSKKNYTAKAILKDNGGEWEVIIYSGYKTEEEAQEGIKFFAAHGYNIVKAWIE